MPRRWYNGLYPHRQCTASSVAFLLALSSLAPWFVYRRLHPLRWNSTTSATIVPQQPKIFQIPRPLRSHVVAPQDYFHEIFLGSESNSSSLFPPPLRSQFPSNGNSIPLNRADLARNKTRRFTASGEKAVKVAVLMVESRCDQRIGVVLRHAAAVFWADGSRDARSVPFVLVHDQANSKYVHSLPPIVALLSSGRLRTWCLLGACSGDSSTSSSNDSTRTGKTSPVLSAGNLMPSVKWQSGGGAAYSHVLFQPYLWAKLTPATHVLVMQTDTWLCVGGGLISGIGIGSADASSTTINGSSSRSRSVSSSSSSNSNNDSNSSRGGGGIYQQLTALAQRYDFVGAPDSPHHWNGGLSLRHRLKMLEALKRFAPPPGYHAEDVFFSRAVQLLNAVPAEETVLDTASRQYAPTHQALLTSSSLPSSSTTSSTTSKSSSSSGTEAVIQEFRANFSLSLLLQMNALGKPLMGPYNSTGSSSSSVPSATAVAAAIAETAAAGADITTPKNYIHRQSIMEENEGNALWSPLPSSQGWATALRRYPLGKRLEPLPFIATRVPPLHVALAFALRAGPGKNSHGAWRSIDNGKGSGSGASIESTGSRSRNDEVPLLALPLGFHQCESYPSNPLPSPAFVAACRGVGAVLENFNEGRGSKSERRPSKHVQECPL